MNCTGPAEAVFEYRKALRYYTSSNMTISGNSTVDLLVIVFSPNEGHFPLKSLRPDLV